MDKRLLDAGPPHNLIADMRHLLTLLLSIPLAFAAPVYAVETPPATTTASLDYKPSPAIWKLSDADTTIYMFGTIHALPKSLKWRSPELDRIIGEVDELVLETVDERTEFLDDQMVNLMVAGLKQKPLLDRVKPENRDIMKDLAQELKLPMDYLDLLPTWMVPFVVFYQSADGEGVSPDYGVETILEAVFKDAKKPVSGIEDGQAVNAALSALSVDEQLVALNDMLDQIRLTPEDSVLPETSADTSLAEDIAWSKGDVAKIGDDLTPETLGRAYYEALLVNRNKAWTDWLVKRLEQPGTMLLAVGSAHLAGEDSVQILLKAKGLNAERIH